MSHVSFPSIEGLHNVVKTYEVYPHIFPETQVYRGKPKLHGTNAGVRIDRDGVTAQSRSIDLTVTQDSHSFAKWVKSREPYFLSLNVPEIVIFGEWAGPGIMKGTSCNLLPEKFFAIFMVMVIGSGDTDEFTVFYEPDDIQKLIGLGPLPHDVHILPWMGQPLDITWADRLSIQRAADIANAEIEVFEVCDPYVLQTFGIEGPGEGLVYYPLGVTTTKRFGDFAFKAKGQKHRVSKVRTPVQIDPEVAASVDEFVTNFVTEPRLEQGLDAIGGRADTKLTGNFLAWVGKDVEKESEDELEASGLEWKQVAKKVNEVARTWFISKAKTI